MQGDAAKGREGSFVEGNGRGLWKFRDQQARHASYFGVDGVTRPAQATDRLPECRSHIPPMPTTLPALLYPNANGRCPNGCGPLARQKQAVAADLADDFPNQVGRALAFEATSRWPILRSTVGSDRDQGRSNAH